MAQLEGLVLNSKKLELKHPKVSFFGAEYSVDGMHPCPKKIQGITEMTPPIDKQQLASFIGMVTYMGNFVPHLSHHTEPLRAMLKQDALFQWDEATNASFQKSRTSLPSQQASHSGTMIKQDQSQYRLMPPKGG